jgi:hypothetical protein
MKKPTIVASLVLLVAGVAGSADDNPNAAFDAKRLHRELPATWECVSQQADQPKELQFIKHVTPTHFTWVIYDRQQNAILAVTGGTWSLKDGHYEETIEFASDDIQQLRGKSFPFTIQLVGDRWEHKSAPGSEIDVDEVWTRMKQGNHQKKNTDEPGRQLLGTWDEVFRPGVPKAIRTVKHVTPTHWTWVTYDRDNKRVLAAGGGTWSLRNGEYVEDCDFTTDNLPQLRKGSFPLEFRIDGDRWIVKGGFNRVIRDDQTWTRLKKPNP